MILVSLECCDSGLQVDCIISVIAQNVCATLGSGEITEIVISKLILKISW
jgi:hypothetical protein